MASSTFLSQRLGCNSDDDSAEFSNLFRNEPKAAKAKVGQNKKVIHPNSRKAAQIARQLHHEDKLERRKDERQRKLESLAEKLKHFQSCLVEDKSDYTKQDLVTMLDSYFSRFEDELEQIAIVNSIGDRKGQRHASREQMIRAAQKREKLEFETAGTEVPDLLNKKNLEVFKEWDGDVRYISNIRLRKLSVKDRSDVSDPERKSKMIEASEALDASEENKNNQEFANT